MSEEERRPRAAAAAGRAPPSPSSSAASAPAGWLLIGGVVVGLLIVVVGAFVVQSQRTTVRGEGALRAERAHRRVRRRGGQGVGADDAAWSTRTSCARSAASSRRPPATGCAPRSPPGKVQDRLPDGLVPRPASTTDYSSRALNAAAVVLDTSGPGRVREVPRPAVRRPARRGQRRPDRQPSSSTSRSRPGRRESAVRDRDRERRVRPVGHERPGRRCQGGRQRHARRSCVNGKQAVRLARASIVAAPRTAG